MSFTTTMANAILRLYFNGTPIANVADNAVTAPLTNLQISLHTGFPGEAGNQATSEANYTGYTRMAVARTTAGFTVTNDTVALTSQVNFPIATGGVAQTLMYFGIGRAATGAGTLDAYGFFGSTLGPCTAATTGTITIGGLTGLAVNDRIAFVPAAGAVLPTGMTAGTVYFVLTVTGDAITVSTTQGGTALALTTAGDAIAFRVTPVTIPAGGGNVVPQLFTGQSIFVLD